MPPFAHKNSQPYFVLVNSQLETASVAMAQISINFEIESIITV